MPQAPKPLNPSLSERHRFGAELRTARLASGLSQAELANLIHVHPDLIAKVEKAVRWPSQDLVRACDSVLGAAGKLTRLWPGVMQERHQARLLPFAERPAPAADALEPIETVAGRLWRLGGHATESAMSVLEIAVSDVVHRYEAEGPASLAPRTVRLRHRLEELLAGRPSIAQQQQLLVLAGRVSGLLAYMAVNLGQFHHADAYGTEAFALAKEAGDAGLMAWVRGTQSFASYYRRDYHEALAFARDGLAHAGDGQQAVRLRVNGEARALAFLPGHQREAERAVTEAYKLADRLDAPSGISPCISLDIYSSGRVVANAITVLQTVGKPKRVIELIGEIETTVQESDSDWSRSLVHLDHAASLLHHSSPDVEQAVHVALGALAASAKSPITSVLHRGKAIANAAEQYERVPAVREYQEQLRIIAATSRRLSGP